MSDFVSSYSTAQIVRATTASAMTVEQWERVWTLVAPVIVAAGRFLDVEQEAGDRIQRRRMCPKRGVRRSSFPPLAMNGLGDDA